VNLTWLNTQKKRDINQCIQSENNLLLKPYQMNLIIRNVIVIICENPELYILNNSVK